MNSKLEVEAQILRSSNDDLQAQLNNLQQEYDTSRQECSDHVQVHKLALDELTSKHEITRSQLVKEAEDKLEQLEDVQKQLNNTKDMLKLAEEQKRILIEVRDLTIANTGTSILAEETVLVDDNQAIKKHSEDQDKKIAVLQEENKTLQEENKNLQQRNADLLTIMENPTLPPAAANRAPPPSIPTFTAPPPPVLAVAPLPPTLAVAPLPQSSAPIIPPLPPTPAPSQAFRPPLPAFRAPQHQHSTRQPTAKQLKKARRNRPNNLARYQPKKYIDVELNSTIGVINDVVDVDINITMTQIDQPPQPSTHNLQSDNSQDESMDSFIRHLLTNTSDSSEGSLDSTHAQN